MNDEELRRTMATADARRSALRPAIEFWSAFREQAARCPQDAASASLTLARRAVGARRFAWFAGPAVAAAAAWVAALWIGGNGPVPDAVHSYRVGEDVVHGGIMILNDEPSHATILWIVDLADNA